MSRRTRRSRSARTTGHWRDIPDRVILSNRHFSNMPSPESLHPDDRTMNDYVTGSMTATAITDSYRFNFPVKVVTV